MAQAALRETATENWRKTVAIVFTAFLAIRLQCRRMKPGIEKRKHHRYRERVEATVVTDEGLTRVPAEIVDTSVFGAKLKLAWDIQLPNEVRVLFGHRIELCKIIWRDTNLVGLAYLD